MFKKKSTVSVMGLGYIGLPTAALLADHEFQVYGCDINSQVVSTINQGDIHIVEKDLDMLVHRVVRVGYLKAALEPKAADFFLITVPTPITEDKKSDIHYVESAAKSIAPFLLPGNVVILESTSPVGTTEHIARLMAELRPDLRVPLNEKDYTGPVSSAPIHLAYCPERVLPGKILKELVENDRIIGGINSDSSEKVRQFYEKFVKGDLFITDSRTAELAKLTENAYRDVNIAFANELSMICDQLKINVWDLIRLANHHPRVNILQPGPGVGGHCIAVDPWFIVESAPECSSLIRQARLVNDCKPKYVIKKIIEKAELLNHPTIACLGLTYKPNIDDIRESPSLEIAYELVKQYGNDLLLVEPHVKPEVILHQFSDCKNLPKICDLNEALEKANIIVLLVDHQVFDNLQSKLTEDKIIIDTRGVL